MNALLYLAIGLVVGLGCGGTEGPEGTPDSRSSRPCAGDEDGCACNANTMDDGTSCESSRYQDGFCCDNDNACVCTRPTCGKSSTLCACGPASVVADEPEEQVVASCTPQVGETCCLGSFYSLGALCTCSTTGCFSFETQVASCDPRVVAGCHADDDRVESCD